MNRLSSAILDDEESEYYNKLRSFVIKLSEMNIKQAQELTYEFEKQSFYSNLKKIIRYFKEYTVNDYNRQEHNKLKNDYKILKNQLAQLNSQKDTNLEKVSDNLQMTLKHIKVNNIEEAYKLSEENNISYLKDLLNQVLQYRWVKSYTFLEPQSLKEFQFTSEKGQELKTLVRNKVDVLKQVNEFFLTEIDNIKNSRPPQSQLPSHIFSQKARKLHEDLLAHFREIRTQIKNRQQELRTTIKMFMREFQLGIDQTETDEPTFIQHFLSKMRERLLKKRQFEFIQRQKSKNQDLLIKSCRSQIFTQNKDVMLNSFMRVKGETKKVLKKPSLDPDQIILPVSQVTNIIDEYKSKLSLVPIKFEQTVFTNVYEELKHVCGNISTALNYYKDEIADLEQKLKRQRQEIEQQRKKIINKETQIVQQTNNIQWSIMNSLKGDKYAEYQNRINQLNGLIKQLTTQNQHFHQQLKKKQQEFQSKQLQLNKLKLQKINISNLQTAELTIQEKISNISQNGIDQFQKLLNQKDNEIQALKQYKNNQKNKLRQKYEQKLASQKIRYRKLAQQIDDLNDKIEKVNNMYLQRLQYEVVKTPLPKRISMRQLAVQTDDPNLTTSISYQKRQSQNELEQSQDINNDNDGFTIKSSDLEVSSKIINLTQFNNEIKSFQSEIKTLEFKVEIYQSHIQRIQIYYHSVIMHKDNQLTNLQEIAQTLKKERDQLRIKLHRSSIKQITHNEVNINNLHLFPAGGIFQYYNYQERLFLIERLSARLGKIKLTRLIYRTDNYNRTNFHRYIDGYRNIVVIVKTVLGKLIAGFSDEAFNSKGIVPGYGMILSLWKKKAYELRDKRAISYDDYYLIFGNSEIRLRSLEFKLFSNFGISNSFYDSRGDKVHQLLGEGNERDVDISGFQVYALELED